MKGDATAPARRGSSPAVVTDNREPFGVMLRRLREDAGMTREGLAERAGLSPRAISALERSERQRPYPHTVHALAAALSLSPDHQAALEQAGRPQQVPVGREWSAPYLVGRDGEIEAVTRHLTSPRTRLITLTGAGGVGKTQLALAVAERAGSHWREGVIVVALAPLRPEASIAPAIAQTLGLRDAGPVPPADLLSRYLATRRLLLILDNLEHLSSAPAEVAALLAAAPGVVVLGTSRSPLRLRAERVFHLNPLAVDPAVQLFRERAAEAGLDTSAVPRETLAHLCQSLDCLPLAIEIAAARSRILPPEALLARADAFDLLGDGAADMPERQRTLHAAIEWSYRLLDPLEQSMFRSLAVFPDSWTLDAAAAVTGAGDLPAIERLARLIHLSLVTRQSDAAEPRFGYLATIRGYASNELTRSGEGGPARGRHAGFYRDLALAVQVVMFSSEFEGRMARLRSEQSNLIQSLHTLLERGDLEDYASMCFALCMYWARLGRYGEGRRWTAAGLESAHPMSDVARARLLMSHASMLYPVDQRRLAARELGDAAGLFRQARDLEGLAWVLNSQSVAALLLGEPGPAAAFLDELDRLTRRGVAPGMADVTLVQRAFVATAQGRFTEAEVLLAESEVRSRAAGVLWNVASALLLHGSVALHQGDDERAAAFEAEAIAVLSQVGDSGQTMAHAIMHMAQATATTAPRRCALWLGVLDRLVERSGVATTSLALLPDPREKARNALGDPHFNELLAQGRALSGQELVALAVGS
jgi:predicted ATPase/DNA-binding XRE family transcriptional regulator